MNNIVYDQPFEKLCFSICRQLENSRTSGWKRGLQSDLTVTCSSCEEESSLETSFFVGGKSADINRRPVYYSI